MPHAYWVLCISANYICFYELFGSISGCPKKKELFGLYLVFLLCYYYPFHIIIFSFLLFDQFDECFIFSVINESFLKSGNNIYYCLSFFFLFSFCLFFPLTTRFLHCIKKRKKMTFTFSYIPVVLFKIQITFLKLKLIF